MVLRRVDALRADAHTAGAAYTKTRRCERPLRSFRIPREHRREKGKLSSWRERRGC
jgi:hypothetical protein